MNKDFLRLLKSFEALLPLKKSSDLTDKEVAMKILGLSEGYIGEIASLLKKASIKAIDIGSEKITLDILDNVGYVSPSARKFQ